MVKLIQKIFKTLRRVSPRGLEGLSLEPFEEQLSQFFVSKLFFKKSDIFPLSAPVEGISKEVPRWRRLGWVIVVISLPPPWLLYILHFYIWTIVIILFSSFSSLHSRFSTPSFVSGIGMTIRRWVAFLFPINQDTRTALLLAKSISPPI